MPGEDVRGSSLPRFFLDNARMKAKIRALRLAPLALLLNTLPASAADGNGFLFSAYKDATIGRNEETGALHRLRGIEPVPLPGPDALAHGVRTLSLAFANGECGDEKWHALPAQKFVDANLAALSKAGIRYVISTGGEGGGFTCATDAGMARFVARYLSPGLVGFDFDIENRQTPEQIDSLVARVRHVEQGHPGLRYSFTLATLAASDGSGGGLNALGEVVMQAIRRHGLSHYTINLMVMDYGPAASASCVVADGRCDMAASALQAARNLTMRYGVPPAQIEFTAMIGVNDVVTNVFTADDARRLARDARRLGYAGLHYWSLDRDQPCADSKAGVMATCSTLADAPADAFARAFAEGLAIE